MSRTALKSVFSGAVYHKRMAMGLTQEEVAEAVSTSVRWYQRIEKGQVLPIKSVQILPLQKYSHCHNQNLRSHFFHF